MKLIRLLQELSPWELKSFEKYVASPFFNQNKRVTGLLALVIREYPRFSEEKIAFKRLHQQLFKTTKFNHQQLRYVITDLTILLEDYLAYEVYYEKSFYQKKFLLQKLKEKKLDKDFRQHLTTGYQQQIRNTSQDIKHFKRQLGYDELSYEYTAARDSRSIDSSLQNLSDNLDVYYISCKLKYCCEMLNRQNILNLNYKIPILPFLLAYLRKNNLQAVPIIVVYQKILQTIVKPEEEKHYGELKKVLTKFTNGFSKNELRDIYAFVQNYCIRKINLGNENYLKELFELYKEMLERELLLENGQLAHSHFKNIAAISIRLNELSWTDKFIQLWSKKLDKALQKNSVNYNLARLYFARREYRPALKLLTAVEFTDVYYHLDAKSLLLKSYYEMEDWEPLFSLVNTFRIYLRRSKLISAYQRSVYANLITQVRRLAKIKSGSNYSLQKIKNDVLSNMEIADIGWLKSKIDELEY